MNPLKSRRGSSVTGMPTVMIVLGVLFVVGLIVIGNLRTIAVAMDLGTQGNATRTTLRALRVREGSNSSTTYSSRRSRRGRGNSAFDLGVIFSGRSRPEVIKPDHRCRSRNFQAVRDLEAESSAYLPTSRPVNKWGTAPRSGSLSRGSSGRLVLNSGLFNLFFSM